ncbi:hypothetical protein [Jiangella sp. DSM 45060]|uniref:hypothetical protein n=1 Tax=Jiangella sp. DSM 45060 TaxID=1798224 RepID=UPI0012FE6530|nr:hypothetical protein [Jiangella sp. DSM 45060]
MLDTTVASVNSAMQRARAGVAAAGPTASAVAATPDDPHARAVVDRYAHTVVFQDPRVFGLFGLALQ